MTTFNACKSLASVTAHYKPASNNAQVVDHTRNASTGANETLDKWKLQ